MTKQQKQAIQNAINKCKFPIVWDYTNKQRYIEVPTDHIDSWREDMFAAYLNRDFGFGIQQVIPGSVTVKSEFNPEMTERVIEPVESNCFLISGKDYRITYLKDSDKPYSYIMTFIRHIGSYYEWISRGREVSIKKEEFDRWIENGEVEKL